MAINDFAGPIINAFLSGQQMRRQSEQDALAQQEREARLKQQEVELKRLEKQDAMQLALARMQIEDRLRAQVASGQRTIPTVGMDAPGGVQAPAMNPLAQQMLAPSAVQELPLQNVSGQTAPMQLGKEFAIPETNRVQDPIVRIPEFGEFDLRGMPGPEDILKQELLKRRALMGEKVAETELVEGIKTENQLKVQRERDAAAMNRTQVTAGVQKDRNEAMKAQAEARAAERQQQQAFNEKKLDQDRELALARIEATKARAAAKAKGDIPEEDLVRDTVALLKDFDAEILTKEDLFKFPQKERARMLRTLQENEITPLTQEQKASVSAFGVMSDFVDRAEKLAKLIDSDITQGLPGTQANNLVDSLVADLEVFGRGTKEVKGVFSDKDIERIKKALPSASPRGNRSADNAFRVKQIKNQLISKFREAYKGVNENKIADIAERSRMKRYLGAK